MDKTKGWDDFFNKKHDDIIKENIDVNPNQIFIEWDDENGYCLNINTSIGTFTTNVKLMNEDD